MRGFTNSRIRRSQSDDDVRSHEASSRHSIYCSSLASKLNHAYCTFRLVHDAQSQFSSSAGCPGEWLTWPKVSVALGWDKLSRRFSRNPLLTRSLPRALGFCLPNTRSIIYPLYPLYPRETRHGSSPTNTQVRPACELCPSHEPLRHC